MDNEIFGTVPVNSAMSGGDYITGKHAMLILAEALHVFSSKGFLNC